MNRYSFFLHAFYGGGAEKILITIANQLTERGETVDIVVGNAEGPTRELVNAEVRIVDLGCDRTYKAILPLARYLRKERPTAMLTSVIHANIATAIAHWLARSQSRLVLREANPEHTHIQAFSARKGWVLKKLAYWAYRRAHVIVSVSQALAETVRDDLDIRDPEAVTVIYNPIAANFKQLSEQPIIPALDANSSLPLIVGVGRLVEAKGFHILIRAVASLKTSRPVRLVIAGQGDSLASLRQLAMELGIAERVTFPGFVSNPLPLISSASVYVLSSYLEGMPNSLLEAVACGTPVVASDCPTGPREILRDGKIGALVPMGDVEAMANAIVKVLDGDVPRFDHAGWLAQFELNHIVDKYVAVMNPPAQLGRN